jgi:hypothetical protein
MWMKDNTRYEVSMTVIIPSVKGNIFLSYDRNILSGPCNTDL